MNGTLSLLDELETTLATGSSTRGIEILTSVTDLFINGAPHFSENQIGVFDDVMTRLMVKIEAKARAKLAQRLASIANAPSNVIKLLAADDDIEVARPVLTRSERLSEHTLVATANSKSQQHLYAITQRGALSEAVTDILVERGDRDVVHAVVKNRGARFSDAGFHALVKRSNGDDALASELMNCAASENDPLWRLPLWRPYEAMLESKVADINNVGGSQGGAITAALFMRRFVSAKSWLHFDLFAWSATAKPGRPEGGDCQAARALYALLAARYG